MTTTTQPRKTITLLGQWKHDGEVEAFEVNGMMTIPSEEGVVYVRKEDAMQFFDLVPVMPEQAEPVTVEAIRDAVYENAYDMYCCQSVRESEEIISNIVNGVLAAIPKESALLARVAELEAENAKLKEDAAWIPIEHCDFDVPVLVKVDGVVQNIVVEQVLENQWLICESGEVIDCDFTPSHFKYLPKP